MCHRCVTASKGALVASRFYLTSVDDEPCQQFEPHSVCTSFCATEKKNSESKKAKCHDYLCLTCHYVGDSIKGEKPWSNNRTHQLNYLGISQKHYHLLPPSCLTKCDFNSCYVYETLTQVISLKHLKSTLAQADKGSKHQDFNHLKVHRLNETRPVDKSHYLMAGLIEIQAGAPIPGQYPGPCVIYIIEGT